MTRKAVKRIIKKKRQIKKQIKHKNDQQPQPQQRPMLPLTLGFGHQQYGNPDFAIQQMRNQNQMTTDQINNYRVVLDAMTKEKEKNQTAIKDLKHQLKDAKAQHEQSKLDLDIAQDQASRITALQKQSEYYLDKHNDIEQQVLKEHGNGEVIQKMRELQDAKNKLHEEQIKNIQYENQINANKMADEVNKVRGEVEILSTKNQSMFEYIGSDMFKNPQKYLSEAYNKRANEQTINNLLTELSNLNKQNLDLAKQINNDYEKNIEEMVEQIKNNINAKSKLLAINQQENQLLKARESTYNHLLDTETKTINETNDLELENARLQFKFTKVNKQPEVYTATKKQQLKLATATAKNETLKTKLDLQTKTKNLELENSMLEATDSILNNKNNNNDNNNKQPKQRSRSNNNTSMLDDQINEIVKLSQEYTQAQNRNDLLKQSQEVQEQHTNKMLTEQAKQAAYDNNNDNNNDDDAIITQQANYNIEKQKTINKLEEDKTEEQTRKAEMLKILSDKCKNLSFSNVWRSTFHGYYPKVTEEDGKIYDVRKLNLSDLENKFSQFKEVYASTPAKIKFRHDHFAKAHKLEIDVSDDDDNNYELKAENKRECMISDMNSWHAEYDPDGEIWYNLVAGQQETYSYPYIDQENTISDIDISDLDLLAAIEKHHKLNDYSDNNND